MKVTRLRDRRTVDLSEAEAQWLVDHGFATEAKAGNSKTTDDDTPAAPKADDPKRRRARRTTRTPGPHSE